MLLGKLCYYHYDEVYIQSSEVEIFLNFLPIKSDTEIAQSVNNEFFQMILKKNPALMIRKQ